MKQYIERSMSFTEYVALIDDVLARGETTGPKQSPEMTQYTIMNRRRMQRLEKTVWPDTGAAAAAKAVTHRMYWLVITEAWCGDAAQNIPVIEKFAGLSDNIETRYLLRDENPDLMDRFLTNGTRSIPKLIALGAADLEVLGAWGPRPLAASDHFFEMKSEGLEKDIILERMQRWYNADKGASLSGELSRLVMEWHATPVLAAAG